MGDSVHAPDCFVTHLLGGPCHICAHRYFPLRAAVAGLALLCDRLFGVTLRDAPLAPGEAWAPGVRKLAAHHPGEGPLGCVYLDLRPRRHKFPGAAHFVIRAGRSGGDATRQLARMALVASLGGPRSDGGAGATDNDDGVLLSHAEVELLFHEAGHALHSLLSRTSYQHLSGTRGAQDCVEAPSTLLERFAWHPDALRAWARHPTSGDPIPRQLVQALRASRAAFAATDSLQQLVHAAADLALHGAAGGAPPRTPAQAAALAAGALAAHTPWPPEPDASARGAGEARFGHVVGYGSTYYAYAYGVALSGAAWRALELEDDPLAPAAGGRLWRHVLRPGGSADPAEAFAALLGPDALRPLAGGWAPDAGAALRDVLHGRA